MTSAHLGGDVALVTGATSGIGAATAVTLAGRGAHVLVSGRDGGRGEAVVAAIRGRGGKADFVAGDLGDARSARALAREAVALGGGRVDILVNNAGVYPFGPTERTPESDVDTVYALNVKAPFYLVAELAPAMAGRGRGAIVNVSTMVADYGAAGMALYGSSKAALNLLTKSWAAEYGPRGVRVNAVEPGPTRTEGTSGMGRTSRLSPPRRRPGGPRHRRRSPRPSPIWPATRRASCTAWCSPWTAGARRSDLRRRRRRTLRAVPPRAALRPPWAARTRRSAVPGRAAGRWPATPPTSAGSAGGPPGATRRRSPGSAATSPAAPARRRGPR